METTETLAIARRRNLPYAEFERDYLIPNRPVILTGCMENWPALSKWSPEFFKREYGAASVTVEGEESTLGAFIDRVLDSSPAHPSPYLKDVVVKDLGGRKLMNDIEPFCEYSFPNWLPGDYLVSKVKNLFNSAQIELFIGGEGTKLGEIHYDYIHAHTVLCQIYGRKAFTVFPPEDAPWLYAKGPMAAIKDLDSVDRERFPLFDRATPISFVQEPGEIVFLPSGWWHTTRLLSASIAVGVNFANASNWAAVIQDLRESSSLARLPLVGTALATYLSALGRAKEARGPFAGADELGIVPAQTRLEA
ncbi:cupin-like domain-containing protein [Methylocapsa acidiphila]|uniref:cupin-like domain-containing protein n=1 Tax=Methylocapsa acidiphila TaxID=133552 RepID=UPI0018DB090F|nr:cupin-like domain-containing protein [Methylocapsa acidiphila]